MKTYTLEMSIALLPQQRQAKIDMSGAHLMHMEKIVCSILFSSLHESITKLSSHQVKQSLEHRGSSSRSISSSTSKNRITLEEFQNLAMPIYLKTIKKIP